MAEQLLLPSFALPSIEEPEPEMVAGAFDFSPEALPEPVPIELAELELSDDSREYAAPKEPVSLTFHRDLVSLTFHVEPLLVEEPPVAFPAEPPAAVPPAPPAPVAAASESNVPVSSTGLLFGAAPAAPAPAAAAPERPLPSKRREIVFVTLAAVVSGVVTLGWLLARTAPGAEVTVAAATPATPPAPAATATAATATAAALISAPRKHQWTAANSAVWAGDVRNAIAFEVEAENTVGVWMRTVRPALIVRCSGGTVEVFVFTASAARIEPRTDDHTVHVSIDGGAQVAGHWRDSEEHDSLFAPDGAAFMRQLLTARVLHFGFTPHNAIPVTAEFNVAGLPAIVAPVSRQCGVN